MKPYRPRFLSFVLFVIVMSLTLTACGGEEEATSTQVLPAADTPAPPSPTDTPMPPPTDTPVPPTPVPSPTNTPEPEVGADFIPFESVEGGFTLRYPDDWFTTDLLGFVVFASTEELLDAPDIGEEGGVTVVIAADITDFGSTDPIAVLEEAAVEFTVTDDAKMTEGPTAVTINGQDAATAVIKGTTDNGTPLSAYLTIIINGDRVAIVLAATPTESEEDFRSQFEAIANSIEVSEPVESVAGTSELPVNEGTLAYGDTKTGAIPSAGNTVWEFIGQEGDAIDIIVRPQTDELDVIIDILDESGDSLLAAEIDDAFGTEELRDFTLPASGTYIISIHGFGDSFGEYEVTLAEAGILTGTEGSIVYGQTMEGSVIADDGSAWSFSGAAGDFIDITVLPFNEFDLVVDVLDATGLSILDEGPIDNSFDTEFIRILRLPSDGQYTIDITGYEGEIGDYEILLDLSNGGQPGSIVFANGTLNAEDTEGHPFPFTALADEVVTLQIDPEIDLDVIIEVYNDDTDELLDEVDGYTGFEEMVFVAPEDGNYYFLVKHFEDSAGEYSAITLGTDRILIELTFGDKVIGYFDDDGLITYVFQAKAGDSLVITSETNDQLDMMLELMDLDGNMLVEVDDTTSGGTETLTYTFTEDLVTYIDVSKISGEPGQFTLLVDSE